MFLFSTQSKSKKLSTVFHSKIIFQSRVSTLPSSSNGCCYSCCCFLLLSLVFGFSNSEFKVLMDNFLANHLLWCTCLFGHLAMIDCCQMIIATATATQYQQQQQQRQQQQLLSIDRSPARGPFDLGQRRNTYEFDWLFLARTNGISIKP